MMKYQACLPLPDRSPLARFRQHVRRERGSLLPWSGQAKDDDTRGTVAARLGHEVVLLPPDDGLYLAVVRPFVLQ